jgi:hypothetical protein
MQTGRGAARSAARTRAGEARPETPFLLSLGTRIGIGYSLPNVNFSAVHSSS